MTGNAQTQPAPALPFGGAAFITDKDAAAYLGVCTRTIGYLVTDRKLRKVYAHPRAARITVESLITCRQAIEEGTTLKLWTQPGNIRSAPELEPMPMPEKKKGFLGRWGLGNND